MGEESINGAKGKGDGCDTAKSTAGIIHGAADWLAVNGVYA